MKVRTYDATFFVIRQPALPIDIWISGKGQGSIEEVAWLKEFVARHDVRTALLLSAPRLAEVAARWADGGVVPPPNALTSLGRYALRMCARCVPYGLMAGCAWGRITDATCLHVQNYEKVPYVRIDWDCAERILGGIAQAVWDVATLYVTSTLRRHGDHYRYVERVSRDEPRVQGEVAVPEERLIRTKATPELEEVVAVASYGATAAQIARQLRLRCGTDSAEARSYVRQLLEGQFLISDIELRVTGDPFGPALQALERIEVPAARRDGARLRAIGAEVANVNERGRGTNVAAYRGLVESVRELFPQTRDIEHVLHCDLHTQTKGVSLSNEVAALCETTAVRLNGLVPYVRNPDLERFCHRFMARWEGSVVPLALAVDEDLGLNAHRSGSSAVADLLAGIEQPPGEEPDERVGKREAWMLRKAVELHQEGASEWRISEADEERLRVAEPPPLPEALFVMFSILDKRSPRIAFQRAGGPSGANLLGRLCFGDPGLSSLVKEHVRCEEELHPDVMFAELVFAPAARGGNVAARPVLRRWELPYFGRSGVAEESIIHLRDLVITVRNNRVLLGSRRHGKEVRIRMSNAHNVRTTTSDIYRFLAELQFDGVRSNLEWDWGVAKHVPRLPRVVLGNAVISPTTWAIETGEISDILSQSSVAKAVSELTARYGLPRWVEVDYRGERSPVDLNSELNAGAFLSEVRQRPSFRLTEMLPTPDAFACQDSRGRYNAEFVLPLVAKGVVNVAPKTMTTRFPNWATTRPYAPYVPGDTWLYVQVFTGPAEVDALLREVIHPAVEELTEAGQISQWFFVRYGDPEWHLRWRLRPTGESREWADKLLEQVQLWLRTRVATGTVWRVTIDSYCPEVERYGGEEGMRAAEELFCLDSRAVLAWLCDSRADTIEPRWAAAVTSVHALLGALDVDLAARMTALEGLTNGIAHRSALGEPFRRSVLKKYRTLRDTVDAIVRERSPFPHTASIMAQRSTQIRSTCLQAVKRVPEFQRVVPHYIHMCANRILPNEHDVSEYVLYTYLRKAYDSLLARSVP